MRRESSRRSDEKYYAQTGFFKNYSSRPLEWYTLLENLYRAFQLTGNPKFKNFVEVWLYHLYWNKFVDTAEPTYAYGVHAYSHVNSFSSAAMAYAVSGNPKYLRIIKNAFDFLQNTQCYATGGFGLAERLMPSNGNLGKSLEYKMDSFETPCGSWAGFKLGGYLMQFTGEARYGDWIERLLYNGIGAALPNKEGGKPFYYADYRIAGVKYYHRSSYQCCAGTYIQNVANYHNLIYYKDGSGLYVNLYLPSEAAWNRPEGKVKLVQDTRYPEDETSTLTLSLVQSMAFSLNLRVPGWSRDMSVRVNGTVVDDAFKPGTWATIMRSWNHGDKAEIRIPLRFRLQPIDRWHPSRVALVWGPEVVVQQGNTHEAIFPLPEREDDLNKWLIPEDAPGLFRLKPPDGNNVQGRFMPYYQIGESHPCRMYFDLNALPVILW